VRNLVNILSNDIQPITNLRILKHVEKIGGSRAEWAREYLQLGLDGILLYYHKANIAYEAIVEKTAGKYSIGDELTMADIVLAPTVEAGIRWGVDFAVLPITEKTYERLKVLPCFEKGDWRHQEDTPQELRA
jgi:maleylacetoacetate isomerase